MPRNGSGTYTLPAGNPVTSGTLIEASWANTTMSDLASAITDSLARNGEGGMTAPMRFADGNVGSPGLSWTNETSTGLYRNGSGDMRVSLQGVDVSIWNSAGLTIPSAKALTVQGNATVGGTFGATGATTLSSTLAVTGAATLSSTLDVTGQATLSGAVGVGTGTIGSGSKVEVRGTNTITDARGMVAINSTNTAGANLGGSVSFGGENGQATSPYVFGSIAGRYEGTNYSGYLQFNVTNSAGVVTERGRIDSAGVLAVPAGMTTATQTAGTNDTTVATTAFVQAAALTAIQALHPVGSIYINATDSTNPATLLGFGTWVAFGAGRVPVGFDAGNALFDAAEETGGSYDAITVSHSHTATSTVTDPGHTHTTNAQYIGAGGGLSGGGVGEKPATINSATTGITVSTTVSSTGSSGTNANVQPYITVYMWKRTA